MVERLSPVDRESVVDVLVASFFDYPVMRYVVGTGGGPHAYEAGIRALIGGYVDARIVHDWPVLGCRVDRRLSAVALISPAGRTPDPVVLGPLQERLRAALGVEAYARMERFEEASDGNEPEGAHHFVGMLGVTPSAQGTGLGGLLLDEVKAMAVTEGLDGVSLSTEDRANLAFYEHMGFRVVGHTDLGDLETWGLVWTPGT